MMRTMHLNAHEIEAATVKDDSKAHKDLFLEPQEAHLARTTARLAIFEAGALIREKFESTGPLTIESKGAFDFVTDIDRFCEDLILDRIRKAFPDHTLMSEERPLETRSRTHVWIVDPLDGTTNFIHGFPMVAVSIALAVRDVVVMGWVFDPLRRELFEARRGQGAWCNGQPLRPLRNTAPEESLVATGFPFRSKDVLDPYLAVFKAVFAKVTGIRRAGSAALDLAYLAAGRVQGFWEAGLKPWDIAAGALLIQEVGGIVTDFWGTENYLSNGHIVAGSGKIHRFLSENLGPLKEALARRS